MIEATAPRILPPLTDVNRAFWTGGASGQLLIQRCTGCSRWVHPPTNRCLSCDSALSVEAVSGDGTIFTLTVNHHEYNPAVPPPYVIAIVVLEEQDDLRIPTNIVNADHEALEIGTRVRVLFERHGDVFVPVFEPIAGPEQ
jgi:uncharacterized protein